MPDEIESFVDEIHCYGFTYCYSCNQNVYGMTGKILPGWILITKDVKPIEGDKVDCPNCKEPLIVKVKEV